MLISRNNHELGDENQHDRTVFSQEITQCLTNLARLKDEKDGLENTAIIQKRNNDELEAIARSHKYHKKNIVNIAQCTRLVVFGTLLMRVI